MNRSAEPFDRASLERMTPTMRNFTLDGKVAIVTGYVIDVSLKSYGADQFNQVFVSYIYIQIHLMIRFGFAVHVCLMHEGYITGFL